MAFAIDLRLAGYKINAPWFVSISYRFSISSPQYMHDKRSSGTLSAIELGSLNVPLYRYFTHTPSQNLRWQGSYTVSSILYYYSLYYFATRILQFSYNLLLSTNDFTF